MKKRNKIGRLLFFIGTVLSACGIALGLIKDTPEPLSTFSMPFIIVGVIVLIMSNFYRVD